MSMFAPEEARKCQACGHSWFAEHHSKPQKPTGTGSFYALGGHHGAAAASASTAAVKYQTKLERYNKWRYCPSCGSKKVKSVTRKGFVPTSVASPTQARDSASAEPGGNRDRQAKTCPCGASLSPAWDFCPMCASPLR